MLSAEGWLCILASCSLCLSSYRPVFPKPGMLTENKQVGCLGSPTSPSMTYRCQLLKPLKSHELNLRLDICLDILYLCDLGFKPANHASDIRTELDTDWIHMLIGVFFVYCTIGEHAEELCRDSNLSSGSRPC